MTTEQIANRMVTLLRNGEYATIYQELFSPDVISAEPEGTPWGSVKGLDELAKKGVEFNKLVEAFHSVEISEPLCADHFIALSMKSMVTWKGAPGPTNMDELCVYTVEDGKIVKEEFFYKPMPNSIA
ncbi:MAG: hypothetical protein ACJA08_000779 [Cyclobacteriaceae bacterium]|jgi:hypothetical protein